MKKLLLVLAIGAFVACNDSGSKEGETADTTATEQAPPPAVDTTTTPIDTTGAATDTSMAK